MKRNVVKWSSHGYKVNEQITKRTLRNRVRGAIIKQVNYTKRTALTYIQSEEFVVLISERTAEIGIKAIKRVLSKILHFKPWIENRCMLISARKCKLYPEATINITTSILAVISPDSTVLTVEAHKVWVAWARRASISLPVQVFQPTLFEFMYQSKTCYSECTISNKSRQRPSSIFPTSKCNHVTSIRIREEIGSVNGKQRDLIHFRSEHSKLWIWRRKRQPLITRRQLNWAVDEKWCSWRKCYSKAKPIRSLHFCIGTRWVYMVRVAARLC